MCYRASARGADMMASSLQPAANLLDFIARRIRRASVHIAGPIITGEPRPAVIVESGSVKLVPVAEWPMPWGTAIACIAARGALEACLGYGTSERNSRRRISLHRQH